MAVAVALGPALGAGLTVLGAAHRVGIGRQQGVDHGLQQTAHQVRGGLSQSLVKGSSRVDNVRSGHRDDVLSRIRWKVDSKDHTVTAPTTNTRASHRRLHHTTGHYPSVTARLSLVYRLALPASPETLRLHSHPPFRMISKRSVVLSTHSASLLKAAQRRRHLTGVADGSARTVHQKYSSQIIPEPSLNRNFFWRTSAATLK